MSFSVVIPTRNPLNLEACLESVNLRDVRAVNRVIVVDDSEDALVLRVASAQRAARIKGIKPFVFARNVNLGIAAAGDDDVIILNDDTRLESDFGFSYLASIAKDNPEFGIISAGITGAVGNLEQVAQPGTRLRAAKHHTLVFVCVYIRRAVLYALRIMDGSSVPGSVTSYWLDERYENYGYDDDDACERVRQLGFKLGIFDGCVVEHGVLPSSYRSGVVGNTGIADLRPNRQRFIDKWGFEPGKGPSMKPKQIADMKAIW